jgi:hypothetical protein
MQKAMVTQYNSREELEKARLLEASQTSYTERFYTLMKLIKISTMISNAKIIHSPQIIENNK